MQRMTRQRRAVYDALSTRHEFQSAQQLHDAMTRDGQTIGLATVYRTLQKLAETREVDVIRAADGEALYRKCAHRDHHHHLVCRHSGHTVDIDGPTVETWCRTIATHHDFTDIEHTIELFGTCSECRLGTN